jgi:ribosomal protein S18 acetylase RimI-like enzyme
VAKATFTWRDPADMTADAFRRDAQVEEVWGAFDGPAVLGVLALYRPDAFVHSLFVETRGRGIGAALLRRVQAGSPRPLSLKVEAANARAIAFYLREGFWPAGRGEDSRGPWIRMSR